MTLYARDVMTRDPVVLHPTDPAVRAARLLAERSIGALPVCDQEGRLLGVVSDADLLKPYTAEARARRRWWLDALAEGTDLAAEFLDYARGRSRSVAELMSREVETASEDTSAASLAEILSQPFAKRVFIVRDGRLVGVVTRRDLVRALATAPEALEE